MHRWIFEEWRDGSRLSHHHSGAVVQRANSGTRLRTKESRDPGFSPGGLPRNDDSYNALGLADRRAIFLVGDVFQPDHVFTIERFMHRDVDHAGRGRGAVPMLLVRRNPDHVAGLDLTDPAALGL